jgi:hypothetical protein
MKRINLPATIGANPVTPEIVAPENVAMPRSLMGGASFMRIEYRRVEITTVEYAMKKGNAR